MYIRWNDNSRKKLYSISTMYPERKHPHPTNFAQIERNLRRNCYFNNKEQRTRNVILTYFRIHSLSSVRKVVADLGISQDKICSRNFYQGTARVF